MLLVISIAQVLIDVLWWIIVVQVVLSWLVVFNVLNTHSQGVRTFLGWLDRFTEPLYRPLRKILPDFGGLDFAPLIVLLALGLLSSRVLEPLKIAQIYNT